MALYLGSLALRTTSGPLHGGHPCMFIPGHTKRVVMSFWCQGERVGGVS